jgi:hypothetical protein
MATQLQPQAPTVAAPQHYTPPTIRELRTEAVHRLQIGMSGLAAMLLLVGLANIIMDRARQSDAESGMTAPAAEAAKGQSSSDPLADIGVVPAADPSAAAPPPK